MELAALTSAQEYVRRLQPRERRLLAGATAALGLLAAFWIVHGIQSSIKQMHSDIANGARRVEQIHALIGQYEGKLARLKEKAPPPPNPNAPTLQAVVQNTASQAGAAENVVSIRNRPVPPGDPDYRETAVEIQLKDLAREPLVKLLVGLDREKLKVSRLQIDAHGEEGKRLFDTSLVVSRFEQAQG